MISAYLVFGYIALWIVLFVYMITLGFKIREISQKVSQLEQHLKRENKNE
jgi:CcmD family protein